MNSNYMFAFNRRPMGPPAAAAPAPVADARSAPVVADARSAPVVADARSAPDSAGRFSINRLINFKSSGGCRSCN